MTIETLVLITGILAVCGTIVCVSVFGYKLAMRKLDVEENVRINANATAERILDKTEKVVDKIIDRTFPSNWD